MTFSVIKSQWEQLVPTQQSPASVGVALRHRAALHRSLGLHLLKDTHDSHQGITSS